MAVISNRHTARLLFQRLSKPSAEYLPSSAARVARLSARRSSGYGRHHPARAARRRVPRTRRRTLMVGELLYVGWAALTCSPLPCAIDSRRAKAYDRLIPDGAGRSGGTIAGHQRPRRRLYRCLARLTASHPPPGAPASPRRPPAGHPDHQAHQPPLLHPGGRIPLRRGIVPGPRGSSPAAMPARPAAPWPSDTAKQLPDTR
jgi:hypothetical protein